MHTVEGEGQQAGAPAANGNRMLEMSAGLAIGRRLGPVVTERLHPLGAEVDHRLDGDHQARFNAEVAAAPQRAAEEIGDLRILVHLPPDTVAYEALDHR